LNAPASFLRRRVCLGALTAAAVLAPACSPPDKRAFTALDITGAEYARDFRLLDTEGRTRTLADYRGKVVMVFFGFTQCPDVCPTALARAADVMQRLGPAAERVQVIFVTIDPERDSAVVLREYTRAFHPSFIGLHADVATTAATARDFKVFYAKVPTGNSYTMDHSTISYVFDPKGHLRLAVKHSQDAASVAQDLQRLLDMNA
jgi:protein SCO1